MKPSVWHTVWNIPGRSSRVGSNSGCCRPQRRAYNPAIILADEPTGNLDSKVGAEVMATW